MKRKLIGVMAYVMVAVVLWAIKPVYGALFVFPTLGAGALALLIMAPIWHMQLRRTEQLLAKPFSISGKLVLLINQTFPNWEAVHAVAEKAGLYLSFCTRDQVAWYQVSLISNQQTEYGTIEVRNSLADLCLIKLLHYFLEHPDASLHDVGSLDPDKLERYGLTMGKRPGQDDAEINFRLAPSVTPVIRIRNRSERLCLASLVKGFRQLHQPAAIA